jgi:hypothetical protein
MHRDREYPPRSTVLPHLEPTAASRSPTRPRPASPPLNLAAGVTLFGALPVALVVRDHSVISAFSAASVAFVLLFAGVITLMAIASSGAAAGAAVVAPLATWDPAGLLVAMPVMAYSFTAHPYFLGIYEMLSAPSIRRMNEVTDQALTITGGVYWLVGLCAYSVFRQRTAGDVLRNFGGADAQGVRGAYERAIKACFGMAVLGSMPLVIIPFYTIVQPLLQGGGGGGGGSGHGSPGKPGRRSSHKARQSGSEMGGPAGGSGGAAAAFGGSSSFGSRGNTVHPRARDAGGGAQNINLHPSDDDEGSRKGRDPAGSYEPAPNGGGPLPAAVAAMAAPVVQTILDPHLDPHISAHEAELSLSFPQHALLTFALLGTGMAAALWLPNLEFIFGLTGATTSVFISYIMPAICFLRLAGSDPEVTFGTFGSGRDAAAPSAAGVTSGVAAACGLGVAAGSGKPGLLAPPELRASWKWRRRIARFLFFFGITAGVLCTHAILGSIKEEKAVVELAQELVAHEVVVAEAAHAQIKAKEAAAAISAVQVRRRRGWATRPTQGLERHTGCGSPDARMCVAVLAAE